MNSSEMRSSDEGPHDSQWNGKSFNKNPVKKLKKNEPEDTANLRKELSTEQKNLVTRLVEFQARFQSFYNDRSKDIPEVSYMMGNSKEEIARRKRHLLDIIFLEYSVLEMLFNRLPGSAISKEDQELLLKGNKNTMLILRWTRTYEPSTDAVKLLPHRNPFTRTFFRRNGNFSNADVMFNFFKKVNLLKMEHVEYAVMQGVVAFSACPELRNPEMVRHHYEVHRNILWNLALQKSPKRVWELQATLNELRHVAGP